MDLRAPLLPLRTQQCKYLAMRRMLHGAFPRRRHAPRAPGLGYPAHCAGMRHRRRRASPRAGDDVDATTGVAQAGDAWSRHVRHNAFARPGGHGARDHRSPTDAALRSRAGTPIGVPSSPCALGACA